MEEYDAEARGFAAIVFFLVGGFSAVVGAHDGFAAADVGARFGGLLLLAAGAVLLAAAIALCVASRGWTLTVGIFAAPAGVLVGASLIVGGLVGPDRDLAPFWTSVGIALVVLVTAVVVARATETSGKRVWIPGAVGICLLVVAFLYFDYGNDSDQRVVIWGAMVIASALAAFALWEVHPPQLPKEPTRWLGGIFGFFTLSALVAGAQFWYTSQFLPASQEVSVTVQTHLHELGRRGRMDIVDLSMAIRNTSKAKAEILGSVYRVDAAMTSPATATDAWVAHRLGRPDVHGATVARYRKERTWDPVQVGRVFADGWSLDPGETYSRSIVIYIPRNRYNTVRSQAEILIGKSSTLAIRESDRQRYPGAWAGGRVRSVVTEWPIVNTSWFRALTGGEREVDVFWIMRNVQRPHLAPFPHMLDLVVRKGADLTPAELLSYNEQTERLYGLSETVSNRELPLDLPAH